MTFVGAIIAFPKGNFFLAIFGLAQASWSVLPTGHQSDWTDTQVLQATRHRAFHEIPDGKAPSSIRI